LKGKLPSFAMWTAFPSSDYYEGSVTIPNIQAVAIACPASVSG